MKPLRPYSKHLLHVGRRGYRGGKPTKQMGVNHLGDDLAPVIPALRAIPTVCPWCKGRVLRHYEGTPEVNCPTCGWEGLLEPPDTPNGPAWR